MLDITFVRDNVDAVISELRRKGETNADELIRDLVRFDQRRRAATTTHQNLLHKRNELTDCIPSLKKDERSDVIRRLGELKVEISDAEQEAKNYTDIVATAMKRIPNLLAIGVPMGNSEAYNKVVGQSSLSPVEFAFEPKDHVALGEALGLMDFEAAAKMSGSRFVVTKGLLARLERALGQFMLDLHTNEHGFTEVNPPLIVKTDSMIGTGQLPKFEDDLYKVGEDKWLIPTAEVSLTNLVRDSIIDGATLPLRYVALTPCFRAEAGSAGRDTRGMIRQHQFYKVELVSITNRDDEKEHQVILKAAQNVLELLGLPYRTVLLCGGDTGFSAAKTFDLEVWLPSQNTYREISSVSDFGTFQARRLDARYREPGETKGTKFVRTFNGSGVAIGRALVAIMENYQNEDGSITVPEALRWYMGGLEVIR